MISKFCNGPRSRRCGPVFLLAALIGVGAVLAGCGKSQTQSLEGQLKDLNLTRQPTAKFAGTVTIDGKPPGEAIKDALFIMAYNPKNPPHSGMSPIKSLVNRKTGAFAFTTYTQGDGLPQGSYIVLFVAPQHTMMGPGSGYHAPDALHNLYNDPDRNEKNPEFKLDLAAPGRMITRST